MATDYFVEMANEIAPQFACADASTWRTLICLKCEASCGTGAGVVQVMPVGVLRSRGFGRAGTLF